MHALVEENHRLREEVKLLTIMREESAYLIKGLLLELVEVKQQTEQLSHALSALLPPKPM